MGEEKGCCGAGCDYATSDKTDEPCWGPIEVVGEECTDDFSDWWWVHACSGHREKFHGEAYIKQGEE